MKTDKKYEDISAYLDEELPPSRAKEISKDIAFSTGYKDKYDEYADIKRLVKKVNPAPESPYFEARLYEKIKEKRAPSWGFIKKYSPVAALTALTIALIFVFKFNSTDINKIIENQRGSLVELYSKNLRPILHSADISKEDIFNFAFYNKLPLDKQNGQYLSLGTAQNGNGIVEIKTASFYPQTNNLERFMSSLNLNANERKAVDSILEAYKEEIKPQILANNKNTIAINYNLWNLNKAIAADLMSFAKRANKSAFAAMMPGAGEIDKIPAVNQMIQKVKNSQAKDTYIFITPDTIFSDQFKFDMASFPGKIEVHDVGQSKSVSVSYNMPGNGTKQIKSITVQLSKDFSKLKKLNKMQFKDKNFNVYVDSHYCKIQVPKIEIPDFEVPNFDDIAAQIEDATKQFRYFTVNGGFDQAPKDIRSPKAKWVKDSLKVQKYRRYPFFDQGFAVGIQPIDSLKKHSYKSFTFRGGDSLGNPWHSVFPDSITTGSSKSVNEQMRMLNEQMKRFQKQMEKMQQDLQNSKPEKKEKKKKPIEVRLPRINTPIRPIMV